MSYVEGQTVERVTTSLGDMNQEYFALGTHYPAANLVDLPLLQASSNQGPDEATQDHHTPTLVEGKQMSRPSPLVFVTKFGNFRLSPYP
jgi:hypothetical protein